MLSMHGMPSHWGCTRSNLKEIDRLKENTVQRAQEEESPFQAFSWLVYALHSFNATVIVSNRTIRGCILLLLCIVLVWVTSRSEMNTRLSWRIARLCSACKSFRIQPSGTPSLPISALSTPSSRSNSVGCCDASPVSPLLPLPPPPGRLSDELLILWVRYRCAAAGAASARRFVSSQRDSFLQVYHYK